jgi:hypothetical protein
VANEYENVNLKVKAHCIHVAAFAKKTSQRKTDSKINQQNNL